MQRPISLITAPIIIASLIGLTALSSIASAATAQQERMTTCNADAKTKALKGDDRKTFMKSCLSGDTAVAAPAATGNSQQEKMKSCNADAAKQTLKGDARKQFMSSCLKAK